MVTRETTWLDTDFTLPYIWYIKILIWHPGLLPDFYSWFCFLCIELLVGITRQRNHREFSILGCRRSWSNIRIIIIDSNISFWTFRLWYSSQLKHISQPAFQTSEGSQVKNPTKSASWLNKLIGNLQWLVGCSESWPTRIPLWHPRRLMQNPHQHSKWIFSKHFKWDLPHPTTSSNW